MRILLSLCERGSIGSHDFDILAIVADWIAFRITQHFPKFDGPWALLSMDFNVKLQHFCIGTRSNGKRMPVVVNLVDAQECVLSRLEVKECWFLENENDHARPVGTCHRGRARDFGLVFVVQVHGGPVTKVEQQGGSEPLEGLASLFSGACFDIQSVSNGHKVHDEHSMVNGVEDLVGNGMPKVGGESHQKKKTEDAVSRNHDFVGKLFAKSFLAVRTE
mmetsp:Transcript_30987/g.74542  ORF Transcript_30987/g.74542 Transcript_30987/m.74542 type:complete len:219 (+) Transcript_30987:2934-3590(+)